MSIRQEKEEGGAIALVIGGFEEGIAPDPYSGTQDLRQVNINTVPSETSVGFPLTANVTSGATLGRPISKAIRYSGYGTGQAGSGAAQEYYILDLTGQVFSSTTIAGTFTYLSNGATTTGAQSTDSICFWKGFLFKFRNNTVDYWNGTVWSNGWQGITGTTQHFSLVSQDDALYFCNGSGIGSILQNAGQTFDPTSGTTYTFNTLALALPTYDIAQSLAEQSTNLLIGGSFNAIYPWDRISTSFRYPIFVGDQYMRKMVTANTNVFIFTGNVTGRGRIYITNGTNANLFFKMPDHISGYQEPYYIFYDAIWHRDSLVFGCEVVQNGTNATITAASNEVWAIDLESKALRGVSDIPGGVASPRVLIPDLSNSAHPGYTYVTGYYDGSTAGIAYSGTAAGTGTGVLKTEIIPVGTFLHKKTYSQVEIKLGYPLQSGESINIQAFTDQSTVTNIATFTSADTTIANVSQVTFEQSQWLQFEVILTGNSALSGCRLKEIRLR